MKNNHAVLVDGSGEEIESIPMNLNIANATVICFKGDRFFTRHGEFHPYTGKKAKHRVYYCEQCSVRID